MAYCTISDLKKVLPEKYIEHLSDDDTSPASPSDIVTEIIAQADGEIDTYLGGRYSVPLSTVPAIIRRCSCDISIYLLYKRRLEGIPDERRDTYKDAVRVLEQIRDGKMNLPELSVDSSFAIGALVTSHFGDD